MRAGIKGIAYYCPHMIRSCTSCFDPGLLMKTYLAINYVSHVKLLFVSAPNTTVLILVHVIYIMIGWVSWQIYLWGQAVETVLSLEQKVVRTAALSDAERFSEIPYSMEEPLNANDDDHHAVAGGKVLCSFSYSLLVIIILSCVGFSCLQNKMSMLILILPSLC